MHAIRVKKLAAGQKVVVNDIESFPFNARAHPCQNDGLSAIIKIRQWQLVGVAHVEEESGSTETNPARKVPFAGTEDCARAKYDKRNFATTPEIADDFLLLQLAKSIRIKTLCR